MEISAAVAIDAMGGDNAPEEIVAGALSAASEGIKCILVGDEARIKPLLSPAAKSNLEVIHTPDAVAMGDSSLQALRKKGSSMAMAINLVKDGRADAVFSAGNTGAFVLSSISMLETIKGVEKSGIAINLPTVLNKDLLLIDAGASTDCQAADLLVFAKMGKVYAEEIMGRKNPTIGLLNIGEEYIKGDEMSRKAYHLLKNSSLNFTGNIEGNAIAEGVNDVIVCDGFVGNTILKVTEGTAGYVVAVIRSELSAGWLSKLGAFLLKPAFGRIKKRIDWKEWGGGVLLGPKGNVLIGHGRSDAKAIHSAIRLADKMARAGLWSKIEKELTRSEV